MTYIDKNTLFKQVEETLTKKGFEIESIDKERPWGGFFVINESQAQAFANAYFNGLDVQELKISGKLSPKILIVGPLNAYPGSTTTDVQKFGKSVKHLLMRMADGMLYRLT